MELSDAPYECSSLEPLLPPSCTGGPSPASSMPAPARGTSLHLTDTPHERPPGCWQHLSWRLSGSRLQKGNGRGTQSNSESGPDSVSSEGNGLQVQAYQEVGVLAQGGWGQAGG